MLSIENGFKRTFVLVGMMAIAACPLLAQERTGGLAGSVQDDFGTAVGDAQINLKSADGSGEFQAVSAADGKFIFKEIKPGMYLLTGVARQGTLMGSLSKVVLTAGNTITVVLSLKAAQKQNDLALSPSRTPVRSVTVRVTVPFVGSPASNH